MEIGQTSNISSEAVKDVQGVVAAAMLKRTLNLQQAMLQELFSFKVWALDQIWTYKPEAPSGAGAEPPAPDIMWCKMTITICL